MGYNPTRHYWMRSREGDPVPLEISKDRDVVVLAQETEVQHVAGGRDETVGFGCAGRETNGPLRVWLDN